LTPEWMTSQEAFKKHLETQGDFDESIGLTLDRARNYQQALFRAVHAKMPSKLLSTDYN